MKYKRLTEENIIEVFEWESGVDTSTSEIGRYATINQIKENGYMLLENKKRLFIGDYLIEIDNEYYPIDKDYFEKYMRGK